MGKAFEVYRQAPPLAKNILVAGSALLVVGGGWLLYRSVKKAQEIKDANKAGQAAANDLENLRRRGIYPTYNDTTLENFAAGLVQAMNGCGTDEEMIYEIFDALRNDADLLRLEMLFGVRFYEPCAASSPLSYLVWQFDDKAYGGDLPTWLSYDLGAGEIANINSILAGNGLTIQF